MDTIGPLSLLHVDETRSVTEASCCFRVTVCNLSGRSLRPAKPHENPEVSDSVFSRA